MPILLDLTLFLFSLSLSLSLSLTQQDHPSSMKTFVAGHRGLVGSAIMQKLRHLGFANLILCTYAELDLTLQSDVDAFFTAEKPQFVILAAAMVGGIHANITYPTNFIAVELKPPLNPPGVVAPPLGHLGGPPQGASGVVQPPPGHAGGGQPANGVVGHPYSFTFFFFLIELGFEFKKGKNFGNFGNFCLTLLIIHMLLPN